MNRRGFLNGVGATLVATAAGCLGGSSEENGEPPAANGRTSEGDGSTSGENCAESIETSEDDSLERFLREDKTPESPGAQKFLAAVENETDGLMYYKGSLDTGRIGFNEEGDTWELRYRGTPHAGGGRFREEIAELSTAFASTRSDSVSLTATSLHECTTGTWHVCAVTAAAYERGELERKTFVDRVSETAEIVNNC